MRVTFSAVQLIDNQWFNKNDDPSGVMEYVKM